MKHLGVGVLLILLFISVANGQDKDRRVELDIKGGIREISVAPDEKIWLTSRPGYTYYTNNIDSSWHYGQPLFVPDSNDELLLKHPTLNGVSYFNKDTAIITGSISADENYIIKNGYYLTVDGGKSWKLLNYGGDDWIYDVYVDKMGKSWMGGSSGKIYYSDDYGMSWVELNSPYNSLSRLSCIYMVDSLHGISGGLSDKIFTTSDNWITSQSIETPSDQKKFDENKHYRISKIVNWQDFLVIKQEKKVFYTLKDKIMWKEFPVNLIDFAIGNDSIFIGVTDSLKVLSFTTPTYYKTYGKGKLDLSPIDMKIVNNALYILSYDNEIYYVSKDIALKTAIYITEKDIPTPKIIKRGLKITWGISGNKLYLKDEDNDKWYRENKLDVYVSQVLLINDSVAILWDGFKKNYKYSLTNHAIEEYKYSSPLNIFLKSPVKSFTISSGSSGCFHYRYKKINYKIATKKPVFITKEIATKGIFGDKENVPFNNEVNSEELSMILNSINNYHDAEPIISDFKISKIDKKKYLKKVDTMIIKNEIVSVKDASEVTYKDLYYSIPNRIDTLSSSTIQKILDPDEDVISTTSNWFRMQIVNENNDTINISRKYFFKRLPWHLPWKVEYKGQNFICYDINLSRFINKCIPKEFDDKYVFDNSYLLMKIAEYVLRKNK